MRIYEWMGHIVAAHAPRYALSILREELCDKLKEGEANEGHQLTLDEVAYKERSVEYIHAFQDDDLVEMPSWGVRSKVDRALGLVEPLDPKVMVTWQVLAKDLAEMLVDPQYVANRNP